jgi:hypothetical protein
MLQYALPPGYQRQQPIKRRKSGPWSGVIDAILDDDELRDDDKLGPAKQRHRAKRISDRAEKEHSFTGGYTILLKIRERFDFLCRVFLLWFIKLFFR